MKSRLTAAFLFLFLFSFGCAHTREPAKESLKQETTVTATTTGTPALEVPEASFDFGEVTDGTEYLHAFVIRNKGDGVLEIRKVVPG